MGFTPTTGQVRGATVPAPDPGAPPFSLLSVAQPLPLPVGVDRAVDTLPQDPLRLDHARCVRAQQVPHCNPTAIDPLDNQPEDPGETFRPVGWTVAVGCDNTPANRQVFGRWADLAKQDAIAVTANQMERFLWSDADLDIQGNATSPSLMSVAVDVQGGTGDPVNPRDGVAQLLQAHSDCNMASGGQQRTLHIPPVLVPYLEDHRVIEKAGSTMRGPLNEFVSVGSGYRSRIGPFDSGDDPTPVDVGSVWIAVSGPVYAFAGEVFDAANPGTLADVFIEGHAEARTNAAQVFLMRRGIFLFDTCCVKAIEVAVPSVTGYTG